MVAISVIIPVYNIAPYIRIAVESVVRSAEKLWVDKPELQIEVICVDDGSTDGSGIVLDELCQSYNENSCCAARLFIKALHQSNAGVSAARNAALDIADGEWVMMLDGDDTWSPDLLVELFGVVSANHDCDAVCYGLRFVDENGACTGELGRTDVSPTVMTGDDVLKDGRGPYSKFIWSSCDKIYRRNVIERHHLRYELGMRHCEDSLFTQLFLAYAGKVVLRPDILGYNYLMRSGSAIHLRLDDLPENPFLRFEVLYAHWQKLRTKGLERRLYYTAVEFPSLGKDPMYAPSVRSKAIDLLLKSRVFNRVIIPFSYYYGGVKAKMFAVAYLLSPRFLRRKLLEKV